MPMDFMQPLLQMGITHLVELLEPDGKHVMTGKALRNLWGRRAFGRAQVVALNTLTRLLHAGPGHEDPRATAPDADMAKAQALRKIHHAYRSITAATSTPEDDTQQPTCIFSHPDQKLITAFEEYMKAKHPTSHIQSTRDSAPSPTKETTPEPAPGRDPPPRPQRANHRRHDTRNAPTLHRDKRRKV